MLAKAAPVDAVPVLLGARGGLRLGDEPRLTVRNGKGGRTRDVELVPELADALREQRDQMAASGHVLPYRSQTRARQRLRRLQERAGVAIELGRAAHSLRHTAGTNARLSGARVLYRALVWVGLEHADPFAQVCGVRDGRAPEAVRPAYSHREVAALLGAATDPHDRAAILLGADAGLRAAEMLALDWSHVTLPERDASGAWSETGTMLVHGKGRTERVVPIGDELADALDALPARSGPVLAHVRSGSGLRYRVACLAVRAGLIESARPPKGSPRRDVMLGLHRLRHRFGTDVVREHGIAVGQAALRHANPQTTARYAKEREHQVASFVRTLRRV